MNEEFVNKRSRYGKVIFTWANALLFFAVPMNGRFFDLLHLQGFPNLIPLALVFVLISCLIIPSLKVKPIWKNKFFKLFTLLFLLYAFSALFYNTTIAESLGHIAKKLSLVVIPFVVFARPGFYFRESKFLLNAYGAGILVSLFLLDLYGLRHFLVDGQIPFYAAYSDVFHPSYLGLNILIYLISHLYRHSISDFVFKKAVYHMLMMVVLLMHIVLLLSKGVIIATGITLLFFTIIYIRRSWKIMAIYFAVFILPLVVILPLPNVFNKTAHSLKERFYDLTMYDQEIGSTSFRTKVLKSAPELLEDNWLLGVGYGNEKAYLDSYYEQKQWVYTKGSSYNTHNQFLQTWLGIGVGGLFVLSILLFGPFVMAISPTAKLMLFCFVFMFCTEAMLERRAGIILFVTFYSLLIGLTPMRNRRKKKRLLTFD